MADLKEIEKAVLEGNDDGIAQMVTKSLEAKIDAGDILNDGLIKGMNMVGDLFKRDELFVPEVLRSAKTVKTGLAILEPLLAGKKRVTSGLVMLGTVKGDIHDIGKNLVRTMLEGAGFDVIDLGIDIDSETFIQKAVELKPHILGMSALLTTTMANMKVVIDLMREAGLRDKIKVMVGGAPVTASFAEEIGADGTASDAVVAVDLARSLAGVGK
jgi:5-methyltetrahydrofolate--homocysteine methyltransferase